MGPMQVPAAAPKDSGASDRAHSALAAGTAEMEQQEQRDTGGCDSSSTGGHGGGRERLACTLGLQLQVLHGCGEVRAQELSRLWTATLGQQSISGMTAVVASLDYLAAECLVSISMSACFITAHWTPRARTQSQPQLQSKHCRVQSHQTSISPPTPGFPRSPPLARGRVAPHPTGWLQMSWLTWVVALGRNWLRNQEMLCLLHLVLWTHSLAPARPRMLSRTWIQTRP